MLPGYTRINSVCRNDEGNSKKLLEKFFPELFQIDDLPKGTLSDFLSDFLQLL